MRVDQERFAVVPVGLVSGDVNLPDPIGGERLDVALGVDAAVAGAQVDVVHVEQEAAPGAGGDVVQEVGLVHLAGERQVVGRVLDQDGAPDRLLVPVHTIDQPPQGVARAGQRQEVREPDPVRARPHRMLRDQDRLELLHQASDRGQVARVGRGRSAERGTDAVEAHRERFPGPPQLRKARSAGHHVVLGVDLEPQGGLGAGERGFDVGLLESDSGSEESGAVRRTSTGPEPAAGRACNERTRSRRGEAGCRHPRRSGCLGSLRFAGEVPDAGPHRPRVAAGRSGTGNTALRGCCGRAPSGSPALQG